MQAHRRALMAGVAATSARIVERLSAIRFARSSAVQASGLAISIDLQSEQYAERVRTACMRRGLIVTTQGAKLLLLPALTIESPVVERGLDILESST
jgi:4-aminobutyrate aminotransferase-like enzyme